MIREANDHPQSGVYLYCFARRGVAAELALPGIDGGDVAVLERGDVAVVYSAVATAEFREAAEVAAPDWLVPRALRHEQVIEAVMRRSPVLPVRFGAVFSSRQVLEELLCARRGLIGRFLDSVIDQEEWSIQAFLDVARAGAWLLAHEPGWAERQRQLPAARGARYFQEKRLQADVRRQVQAWSRTLEERLQEQVHDLVGEVRCLKRRGSDDAGREMVFHGAALVPHDVAADLPRRLADLEQTQSAQGVSLACSGPWPPYHFCPALENGTDEISGIRPPA